MRRSTFSSTSVSTLTSTSTSTSTSVSIALLALGVGLVASSPRAARADHTDACIEASVRGQELRDQGKLVAAREALVACGVSTCPRLLQKECAGWLADVEARTPSIVISATDAAGRDTADVKVTLDGAPFLARLDGQARSIDPGAHLFRFERDGSAAVTQQVILREGERGRVIGVLFPVSNPASPGPRVGGEPVTPAAPLAPIAPAGPARPIAIVVLGGIFVASGVTLAVLGTGARDDAAHLRATCAPACDPGAVDAARAKEIGANVAIGVGVLAASAAAVLVFTWPRPAAGLPGVAVRPTAGGAIGGLTLPF